MFAMSRARLVVAFVVWLAFAAVLALYAFASTASANHSWSTYHWGRTGSSFTLQLDDNVSSVWDPYLRAASSSTEPDDGVVDPEDDYKYNDWSDSSVLDTTIAPSTNTKQCSPTSGRVEVCNANYGDTGWSGLASIWASGGHIVQGTTKLNDYYWWGKEPSPKRQQVMCQEVGHTFGLGHQSTSGTSNFDSCMTYDKAGPNNDQWPDAHDYAQLRCIYDETFGPIGSYDSVARCTKRGHVDTTTTVGSTSAATKLPAAARAVDTADRGQRGQLVDRSANGRVEVYERDFGGGNKVITWVIRIDEATPATETTSGPGRSHTHDAAGHTHEEGTAH
jgi:hypothetical protein